MTPLFFYFLMQLPLAPFTVPGFLLCVFQHLIGAAFIDAPGSPEDLEVVAFLPPPPPPPAPLKRGHGRAHNRRDARGLCLRLRLLRATFCWGILYGIHYFLIFLVLVDLILLFSYAIHFYNLLVMLQYSLLASKHGQLFAANSL